MDTDTVQKTSELLLQNLFCKNYAPSKYFLEKPHFSYEDMPLRKHLSQKMPDIFQQISKQ